MAALLAINLASVDGMSLSGRTMYGYASSTLHKITVSNNFGKSFSDTRSPSRLQWNDVGCDGSGDRVVGVSECQQADHCQPPLVSFDHGRTFMDIPVQPGFDYRILSCQQVALARASTWALVRCNNLQEDRPQVFASQDLLSWKPVGSSWSHSTGDLAISFDGSVFAAVNGTQMLLSADHGLTWSAAPLPAHAFTSLAVNQDGQTIAVGYTSSAQNDQYAGGALVSHDGGKRWQQVHVYGPQGQACEGQVIVSTNAKGDLTYISTDCMDDYVYQYNRSSAATAPLLSSLRERTYGAWTNADGDFVYALTYPDQYCSHDYGQLFINCADQHV